VDRARVVRQSSFVIVSLAIIAVVVLGMWRLTQGGGEHESGTPFEQEARPLEEVTDLVFPVELRWSNPLVWTDSQGHPTSESASMPADVALVDGRLFVLDTNNGRILEITPEGDVAGILDSRVDPKLALDGPMAMTAHEGKLYVANSKEGNVVVVEPDGTVERVIVPSGIAGERPLRPIGIAVTAGGDLFLSDPDNHRVLKLDGNGRLLSVLGSGGRGSGEYGFNTPGSLLLDGAGNLYVVDILNSTVKKYNPTGRFLLSIGQAGDAEGAFSRPKAVAVDGEGNIYVTDSLLTAVEVFGPTGVYRGFVGRVDPDEKESESLFRFPHGLKIVGDKLYVVDRLAGLFEFQLPG
jgi:DNA-binding beta-propeller fold protein YncE